MRRERGLQPDEAAANPLSRIQRRETSLPASAPPCGNSVLLFGMKAECSQPSIRSAQPQNLLDMVMHLTQVSPFLVA
jgi:hypothetical protein